MTKTSITLLCIFCLIIAGVIAVGGYATWEEYRAEKTTTEIGKDILGETDNVVKSRLDVVDWIREKMNFNIGDYFNNLWIRLKNALIEIFDWIPGVDLDDNEDNSDDFGTNGDGYGVPESNGMGGGAGGAR